MPIANFSSMDAATLSAHITTCATRLRGLTQQSCQTQWHQSRENYPATTVLANQDWQHWALAPLNDRKHIAWNQGKQSLWLCQEITVPVALSEFPLAGLSLRLGLTWWADAVDVYVDGVLVQQGDLFDYFVRLPLSDRVAPGDSFTIAIHMLSPGHDAGALVRSEVIYESSDPDFPEPGFVANELTVLQIHAEKLAPERLSTIAAAIAPLDWAKASHPDQFQAELAALRQRLHPLSDWIKQRQIACTGHAHLDLAWLWPVEDTWRAAERTFRSV
ncbi:MAG: alpha-mannosidase, partial [Cyanobacteria bacterium P01_H01_bin.58]